MTSFKVLFAFLAMFMFSIQGAMALPGNTESVPAAAVNDYEARAQKSPAPAEGEPFVRLTRPFYSWQTPTM
ncbi:hypothetical protein ABOM_009835 [Aspergillus bombycis]|uniref:Uncharacterized protein n=1 Tax=Aspergillus bombycis TaxID=109264 RepID=A0A1F7ZQ33_9EURO|nr:hypothetical protein ABOM_009835 [Aspergillus bombycis]OGM41155.1 hypothetical protein ABOM_009835 [Aspergillus bombycis]